MVSASPTLQAEPVSLNKSSTDHTGRSETIGVDEEEGDNAVDVEVPSSPSNYSGRCCCSSFGIRHVIGSFVIGLLIGAIVTAILTDGYSTLNRSADERSIEVDEVTRQPVQKMAGEEGGARVEEGPTINNNVAIKSFTVLEQVPHDPTSFT